MWISSILIFSVVTAEDTLSRINWRRNLSSSDFSKYWIHYMDKLLETSMNTSQTLTDTSALNIIWDLQAKTKMIREHNSQVISISYIFNYTVQYSREVYGQYKVFSPITSLAMESFLQERGNLHVSFTFKLNFHLRLNITFFYINMKIDPYNDFANVIQVAGNITRNESYIFVGIHSKFDLYPSSTHINCNILQREELSVFLVKLNFSIISAHVLENQVVSEFYQTNLISVHVVLKSNIQIFSYHIVVKQYQRLRLILSPSSFITHLIYDGPGYKSDMISHIEEDFQASSFQCFVQLIFSGLPNRSHVKPISNIITMYGVQANVINVDNFTYTSSPYSISFPGQLCKERHIVHCVLVLNSTHGNNNSSINITLEHFTYRGKASYSCIYGGITLLEDISGTFWEHISFCDKFGHAANLWTDFKQITYSKNLPLIFIIHSYKQYSSLTANLSISHTKCDIIKLSSCILTLYLYVTGTEWHFEQLWGSINEKFTFKECIAIEISPNVFHRMQDREDLVVHTHDCRLFLFGIFYTKTTLWRIKYFGYLENNGLNSKSINISHRPYSIEQVTKRYNGSTMTPRNQTWKLSPFDSDGVSLLLKRQGSMEFNFVLLTTCLDLILDTDGWSYSWVNVVVYKTSLFSNYEVIPIQKTFVSIKQLFSQEDVILVINKRSFITKNIKINVKVIHRSTDSYSAFTVSFKGIYDLNPNNDNVIIAMHGFIKSLDMKSLPGKYQLTEYLYCQWMHISANVFYDCRPHCNFGIGGGYYLFKLDHFDKYFVARLFSKNCSDNPNVDKTMCSPLLLSWNSASEYCQSKGGYLPEFYSRLDQEQFLYLMTKFYQPISAIFIGISSTRYPEMLR